MSLNNYAFTVTSAQRHALAIKREVSRHHFMAWVAEEVAIAKIQVVVPPVRTFACPDLPTYHGAIAWVMQGMGQGVDNTGGKPCYLGSPKVFSSKLHLHPRSTLSTHARA